MARSPARKMAQPRRGNYSARVRQGPGSGPWLIASIALALFILGLFYLHSHRKQHEIQKVEPKKTVKTHTKHVAPAKTAQNPPQFDFYTLLPEMQVGDSTNGVKTDNSGAPVGQAKPSVVLHQYILQAGAFKTVADADKVRAALILQGFNVQIKAVQVNGATWQRIVIGPYKSLSEAQQAQEKLNKIGIKSLLFQLS